MLNELLNSINNTSRCYLLCVYLGAPKFVLFDLVLDAFLCICKLTKPCLWFTQLKLTIWRRCCAEECQKTPPNKTQNLHKNQHHKNKEQTNDNLQLTKYQTTWLINYQVCFGFALKHVGVDYDIIIHTSWWSEKEII